MNSDGESILSGDFIQLRLAGSAAEGLSNQAEYAIVSDANLAQLKLAKVEGTDGPFFVEGDIVVITWGKRTLHGSPTSSWLCWSAAKKNQSAKFVLCNLVSAKNTQDALLTQYLGRRM